MREIMDYVDTDLRPLNSNLKDAFVGLRGFLAEQDKLGNILFLYRGEEQRNIRRRLVRGGLGVETPEVFRRAFYFGEKARHFSVDVIDDSRDFLTGINDCSDETLSFIFARISNVINEPRYFSRVRENTSGEFRAFFQNENNLGVFLERMNECYTPEVKLKARDYYLYFLHVAGTAGVRKETMFVSTSIDKRVAHGFARAERREGSRITFHYFVPQPFHMHVIAPWVADHHQRIAYAIRLPTYKAMGLFPKQREVSVKGALFPHFMLGIELVDDQKFIVNSHFPEFDNSSNFLMVARNGFMIDQSEFRTRIFDTGYVRWGQTDLNGNFESNETC